MPLQSELRRRIFSAFQAGVTFRFRKGSEVIVERVVLFNDDHDMVNQNHRAHGG